MTKSSTEQTSTEGGFKPKLLCFNFNSTLVNAHWNNLCYEKEKEMGKDLTDEELVTFVEELLQNPKTGLKYKEEMRGLIKQALEKGHKIAITSFTYYGAIIKPALKAMGLSEEEIEKIDIIAHPSKDTSNDRSEHIREAMANAGIDKEERVVFVDSRPDVVKELEQKGFKGVRAYYTYDVRQIHKLLSPPRVRRFVTSEPKFSMKQLLGHGPDDVNNPLHQAVAKDSSSIVSNILSEGADVNEKGLNGNTALHYAAATGNKWMVQKLVESGAIINVKNDSGQTPLELAKQISRELHMDMIVGRSALGNTDHTPGISGSARQPRSPSQDKNSGPSR